MTEEHLRVSKIRNGTVIDHIEGGQALNVLSLLNIDGEDGNTVSVAMHVPSNRVETKDIVKIESRELNEDEINILSVVAPNATINIIRNYEVTEKYRVTRPEVIEGVVGCPNPHCITTDDGEPVTSRFIVDGEHVRCDYCDTLLGTELGEHLEL